MSSLTRATIDGLWPPGPIWQPALGLDLDHVLEGLADGWGFLHDTAAGLAVIRDPWLTPYLSDLEQEFGIATDKTRTESLRRTILANRKFSDTVGSLPGLQAALDLLGFGSGGYGLTVYDNNRRSNPAPFTSIVPQICAGQTVAIAGNAQAYAGFRGQTGYLIVNGFTGTSTPDYWGAGMTNMVAGNNQAEAGYYLTQTTTPSNYPVPQDANYWPLFFFVGGAIVYNLDGTIASLANVSIPFSRQDELVDLICRVKPMHTWCVACINWT